MNSRLWWLVASVSFSGLLCRDLPCFGLGTEVSLWGVGFLGMHIYIYIRSFVRAICTVWWTSAEGLSGGIRSLCVFFLGLGGGISPHGPEAVR